MPSPFPGMDPYLERPSLWPDVHHGLITQIQGSLNARLRPKYVARVETRVYISDDEDPGREVMIPDIQLETGAKRAQRTATRSQTTAIAEAITFAMLMDEEIQEAYLAVKETKSDMVVTVIEVLSPTNKVKNSKGRKSFLDKRQEVLASDVHWVEIDLLRSGDRTPRTPPRDSSDYRIIASRGDDRGRSRCWPIGLRQPLPVIGIPLKGRDPDVALDLGDILRRAFEIGAYDVTIDYVQPAVPPLRPDDAKWAAQLLRAKGLR
jgi:uncharacterized protein DUF4058